MAMNFAKGFTEFRWHNRGSQDIVRHLIILSIVICQIIPLGHSSIKSIYTTPICITDKVQYQSSTPILITNDTDFRLYCVSGIGSAFDPYIIENLSITSNSPCITIENTAAYFSISNCRLQTNKNQDAIVFRNLKNGRVENTSIYRSKYGIYLKKAINTTIIDCITFYNTRGLVLEQTNRCQILNSTIYGNWQYGIEISTSSHNNSIYGNSIGWNDWHNAFDEGKDNLFDDNTNIGNYWSDYTGQELYVVPGSANSVDSFARFLLDYVAPFLSNQSDIAIDIDIDDNTLTWSAYDEFPHSYIIWENKVKSGPFIWLGGNITLSLDHLELGTHEFNITVFDGAGNQASDDVRIFVMRYSWIELVLFASLITVVIFVIVLFLIKRLD